MQENDPLAGGYDFEKIAVDSAREQARRDSVTSLNTVFSRSKITTLSQNQEFGNIMGGVFLLGANISTKVNDIKASEAYDEFTSDSGIDVESRILCIETGENSLSALSAAMGSFGMRRFGLGSYSGMAAELAGWGSQQNVDKIFLLAANAKGQVTVNQNNVKFGALQKSDGMVEFFKLNFVGELAEEDWPPMIALLMAGSEANRDRVEQLSVAIKLDPVEEQALISEFAKATKVLGEKADQRDAEYQSKLELIRESQAHLPVFNVPPLRLGFFDSFSCIDDRTQGDYLKKFLISDHQPDPPHHEEPEDTPPEEPYK